MLLVSVFGSLVFVLSILFLMCENPYHMMAVLLCESLMVAMFVMVNKVSGWVSYVLIIVFLGGVLVLFAYITSLISDLIITKVSVFGLVLMMILYFVFGVYLFFFSYDVLEYTKFINSMTMDSVSEVLNISMMMNAFLYMFVVIYLFLGLVCISSMVKKDSGPFRG